MKTKVFNKWFALLFTVIMVLAVSCKGDEGPMGPVGPQGEQGVQGVQGAQGIPGKDGNLFYYGNGAPKANLGKEGDMYLDKAASKLYGPKEKSGWGSGQSLIGAKGDKGDKGEKGAKGDKGDIGADGSTIHNGSGAPGGNIGKLGDYYIDTVTGDLWRLGRLVDALVWRKVANIKGNANVKSTPWYIFDEIGQWKTIHSDFIFFEDFNDIFNFSEQTIKDIAAGKYIVLAYIKKSFNDPFVRPLPNFIAKGHEPEFGAGRKMFNYTYSAKPDGKYFRAEINLSSTDGTEVKAHKGNWYYRLVFVGVEDGFFKSSTSKEVLKEELQKLSYEEVCERYGIEP